MTTVEGTNWVTNEVHDIISNNEELYKQSMSICVERIEPEKIAAQKMAETFSSIAAKADSTELCDWVQIVRWIRDAESDEIFLRDSLPEACDIFDRASEYGWIDPKWDLMTALWVANFINTNKEWKL